MEKIQKTARDLRHELLEKIPARDLQVCLRVLTEIRNRAAAVTAAKQLNGIRGKSRNGKRKR